MAIGLFVFTNKIHDEFTEVVRYRTFSIVLLGSAVFAILLNSLGGVESVDILHVVFFQLLAYLMLKPWMSENLTEY